MNGGRITFSVINSVSSGTVERCAIMNILLIKNYLRPGNSVFHCFKNGEVGDL